MSIIEKIKKAFSSTVEIGMGHTTHVYISNKKTTIKVDGKTIDPESAEGKKILKDADEQIEQGFKAFGEGMKEFSKAMDKMSDIFKNIKL